MGFFGFGKNKEENQSQPGTGFSSNVSGNCPCTLEVQRVFQIAGVGTVIVALIRTGVLRLGMACNANGKTARAKTIEKNHKQIPEAFPGEPIGVCLSGITKSDIKQGDVLEFY